MRFFLVFIDTLRADHLGCYGYGRDTSPSIDRMASRAAIFERAYATDVPTQPSFTSTFTGQRGITNGVVTHAPHEVLDIRTPWLPSELQRNGYTTAAVSTLYHMKPYFARGFSHYMNPVAGAPALTQWVTADQINSFAIPWIKKHAQEENLLLFLHFWDVHQYTAPEEYRGIFYDGDEADPGNDSLDRARESPVWPFLKRKLDKVKRGITDAEYVRSQYDAALRYVDDQVGMFIETLEDLGIMEDSFLVLTSDHGESLGEHSVFFDHATVYEDTVRVPLIIRWPDSRVERVGAMVQNIDLAATILELAGLPRLEAMQGRSIRSLLTGSVSKHRKEAYVNQGAWQAKRALITERWKYTRCLHHGFWPCPPEELYDLTDDPSEVRELSQDHPDVLDRLSLRLRRWEEKQLGLRVDPLVRATNLGLAPLRWVWDIVKNEVGEYDDWARRLGI